MAAEREVTAFVAGSHRGVAGSAVHPGERRVGNGNTVAWHRLRLQIPPSPIRSHYVRAMVRVHEYPDDRLAIYHGPHRLAD